MGRLTVKQRYKIQVLQVLKEEGFSQSEIAQKIDSHKSVVCSELKRNCDKRSGKYKAELAEKKCANRHRFKKKKTRFTADTEHYVERLIKGDYSPEQVVGISRLKGENCVSVERIYQHIWDTEKEELTIVPNTDKNFEALKNKVTGNKK